MTRRHNTISVRAYSLAEVLVSLVIASMIVIAILTIYDRFQRSADAIYNHLFETHVPTEVLQLIGEDLDRLHQQENIKVTVENKLDNGYEVSRLTLAEFYYDEEGEEQEFRTIVWQGAYDIQNERVILYRKHSGLELEDTLLDPLRDSLNEEQYPFIPICGGLSLFKVQVPQDRDGFVELLDTWDQQNLPTGLKISLSLGIPTLGSNGQLVVQEDDIVARTIALDRTRAIEFKPTNLADDEETVQ